jgi:hypothetical protein
MARPGRLRKTRFVLGTVNHVDPSPSAKTVSWAGPEAAARQVRYDRLILTAGSVDKLLPIPGLADYAHGFRSISEATYLRDHITRQLEPAAVAADPARQAPPAGSPRNRNRHQQRAEPATARPTAARQARGSTPAGGRQRPRGLQQP